MINRHLLLVGLLSLAGLTACSKSSSTSDTHDHAQPATSAAATKSPAESSPTAADDTAWKDYLARSAHWQKVDSDQMAQELKQAGQEKPTLPVHAKEFGFEPEHSADWFKSTEAQRIADNLLTFQTPSGGWSKRTDMGAEPRQTGQAFGVEKGYIPTFDNGATSTQLEFLASAYSATGKQAYADAFYKGINLIIEAQYPNGGWPQNYPLVGGYHDHVTYNDALMKNLMALLRKTARGSDEYSFVSPEVRANALASLNKGLDCVVKSQVVVNGTPTIWGAQYDERTLTLAKARAYEMAALSASESASLLNFLMDIKEPSPELAAGIRAAMIWYDQNKIVGYRWEQGDAELTPDPDAPFLWPRFVEPETNRAVFGDRDGSIHSAIGEISAERRKGYKWYTTEPNRDFEKFVKWSAKHPE